MNTRETPNDNTILALLLDPDRALLDIAAELGLTLVELIDRLASPSLRDLMAALIETAERRAALFAAAVRPSALITLQNIAADPDAPLESRRKAARQLAVGARRQTKTEEAPNTAEADAENAPGEPATHETDPPDPSEAISAALITRSFPRETTQQTRAPTGPTNFATGEASPRSGRAQPVESRP